MHNGTSHSPSHSGGASNGLAHDDSSQERVGPNQLISRRDYIRILQQALRRLGYPAVAERLERESGIPMQPEVANLFQEAVLEGRFEDALHLLPRLSNNDTTQKQVRFLILQQKFIEEVNRGDTSAAVSTLRRELGPLQINQAELRRLSGCLLQTKEDGMNPVLRRGPWASRLGGTRDQLMQALQQKLPPALLIPNGRLEELLEQALKGQISKCMYHNCPGSSLSLLTDYSAGVEQIPSQLFMNLVGHEDEVWHVQFSHSGTQLASASKDRSAIIWRVSPGGEASILHRLGGHPQAVTHLCWSPNDQRLLTCSGQRVTLWDTKTGECQQFISHHKEATSACAWFPNGRHFLSAGVDKRIFMQDLQGNVLRHWTMKDRINDLALSHDASVIICVTNDRYIELMRLNDHIPVTSIGDEAAVGPSAITSIALTPDGEFLLANMRSHTGHLWRVGPIARRMAKPIPDGATYTLHYGLAPPEEGEDDDILEEPVMEYHAGEFRVGRYVIRSCIGGLNSAFVASGSEDCRVYIWHRDSGTLLAQLEGHSGTVNGVSWNPVHPHMLASASDDRTIGIWMAPCYLRQAEGKTSPRGENGNLASFPVL